MTSRTLVTAPGLEVRSRWTGYNAEQKASYATKRKMTIEEVENELNKTTPTITPREVRIFEGSFNAATTFTESFSRVCLSGSIEKAYEGIHALRIKIGDRLFSHIEADLGNNNIAEFFGWISRGFAWFVYQFIKTEMAAWQSHKNHIFYVYNPDTSWYGPFEELVRQEPLPSCFGGYSYDLNAIFWLMVSNQRTLAKTTPPTGNTVFHLLVPAHTAFVVPQTLLIDKVGSLIIKGIRYKGTKLAWFDLLYPPETVMLQDVGNLSRTEPGDTPPSLEPGLLWLAQGLLASVIPGKLYDEPSIVDAYFLGSPKYHL